MPRTCVYLEAEGYDEYRCVLTGNPVDADCADLTSDWCIPRLALRLNAGTLQHFDRMSSITQEAIQMTAEQIQHPDGGSATAISLESLSSPEQIDRWIAAAKARKRQIAKAQGSLKRLRSRLGRLEASHRELTREIECQRELIAQIEEGKIPAEPAMPKSKKPWIMTPARRAAINRNAAKMHAAYAAKHATK